MPYAACRYILKRGEQKGKPCGKKDTLYGYCTVHYRTRVVKCTVCGVKPAIENGVCDEHEEK